MCFALLFERSSWHFCSYELCIVALGVFSSDSLTWSANRLYSVQWHIKKGEWMYRKTCILCQELRLNVGLETGLWRHSVTSQTAHNKYKWLPYATEWNPHENFLRTPLEALVCCIFKNNLFWIPFNLIHSLWMTRDLHLTSVDSCNVMPLLHCLHKRD